MLVFFFKFINFKNKYTAGDSSQVCVKFQFGLWLGLY